MPGIIGLLVLLAGLIAPDPASGRQRTGPEDSREDYLQMPRRNGSRVPMMHGWRFHRHPKAESLASDPAAVERGAAHYQRYCQGCHGPGGRGDGPAARTLKTRPADLVRLSGRFHDHHFFMVIAAGTGRGMPAWQEVLRDREIRELSAWINSLRNVRDPDKVSDRPSAD